MKKSIGLFTMVMLFALIAKAQTADEIINGYFEVTGGYENWSKITSMQMNFKMKTPGGDVPAEVVHLKNGNKYQKFVIQGSDFFQEVIDVDGKVVWKTNMMNRKPELADSETITNKMQEVNDFPDPLFNYKKKGYKAELVGNESFEGSEVYKIKLTKKPITVEGKEVENIFFHYFDVENNILLGIEYEIKMGPQKGAVVQISFSDYKEVEGLYFPFSMNMGIKGGPSNTAIVESVVLNKSYDESIFTYPGN